MSACRNPFTPVAEHEYDVAVIGGGPAGIGAALAAARLGARTVLIEATCCLGGCGTSGLVPALAPFNYNQKDGPPYLRGVAWETVERLDAAGGLYGLDKHSWWKLFDKEIAKSVFEKMVLETGSRLRYFTFFHGVEMDGPRIGSGLHREQERLGGMAGEALHRRHGRRRRGRRGRRRPACLAT